MNRSTTNRFLTNALRTLCCIAALTACSAWANVITLQSSGSGATTSVVAVKDLPSSTYTNSARGVETAAGTDTSTQVLFKSAPESVTASETSVAPATVLNSALPATGIQQESAPTQPQISVSNAAPEASFSVAASNTQAQPAAGGAIAAAFDEEFVSVPNIQFASLTAAPSVSATSAESVTAVPEMSALFPIVGLIAAVSCTQILRRRRAAQKTAPIA